MNKTLKIGTNRGKRHRAFPESEHDRDGERKRYTLEARRGYYYLVNHETGRETNTGYDCGDFPFDGELPHAYLRTRYRRALTLTY